MARPGCLIYPRFDGVVSSPPSCWPITTRLAPAIEACTAARQPTVHANRCACRRPTGVAHSANAPRFVFPRRHCARPKRTVTVLARPKCLKRAPKGPNNAVQPPARSRARPKSWCNGAQACGAGAEGGRPVLFVLPRAEGARPDREWCVHRTLCRRALGWGACASSSKPSKGQGQGRLSAGPHAGARRVTPSRPAGGERLRGRRRSRRRRARRGAPGGAASAAGSAARAGRAVPSRAPRQARGAGPAAQSSAGRGNAVCGSARGASCSARSNGPGSGGLRPGRAGPGLGEAPGARVRRAAPPAGGAGLAAARRGPGGARGACGSSGAPAAGGIWRKNGFSTAGGALWRARGEQSGYRAPAGAGAGRSAQARGARPPRGRDAARGRSRGRVGSKGPHMGGGGGGGSVMRPFGGKGVGSREGARATAGATPRKRGRGEPRQSITRRAQGAARQAAPRAQDEWRGGAPAGEAARGA
jgi:hypothetical protein